MRALDGVPACPEGDGGGAHLPTWDWTGDHLPRPLLAAVNITVQSSLPLCWTIIFGTSKFACRTDRSSFVKCLTQATRDLIAATRRSTRCWPLTAAVDVVRRWISHCHLRITCFLSLRVSPSSAANCTWATRVLLGSIPPSTMKLSKIIIQLD